MHFPSTFLAARNARARIILLYLYTVRPESAATIAYRPIRPLFVHWRPYCGSVHNRWIHTRQPGASEPMLDQTPPSSQRQRGL